MGLDLLKECLQEAPQGATPQHLQEAFCFRCYQPECTRSLYGKTRFDDRVLNWHERLFSKVPRMDSNDPRWASIQSQQFKMFSPAPPGAQSSWDDPRDLPASSVQVPQGLPEASEVREPEKTPQKVETPPVTPSGPGGPISRDLLLMNTPEPPGGVMLRGAPPVAPPLRDPWAPPAELAEGESLVEQGAKITLGGVGKGKGG